MCSRFVRSLSSTSNAMKYILVTGGVISGIGKGVVASSFGTLLNCCGIDVTSIKIDPYINIDAGTFSPYEHGRFSLLLMSKAKAFCLWIRFASIRKCSFFGRQIVRRSDSRWYASVDICLLVLCPVGQRTSMFVRR